MLALLDQQQQFVMRRQTTALPENVNHINARRPRCSPVRGTNANSASANLAQSLELPENAGFKILIPKLPADYRPLVEALVEENNELIVRVQHRVRQNHLLLSHCVDLMAQLIHSIFPATRPVTYNGNGHAPGVAVPAQSLYEAVG